MIKINRKNIPSKHKVSTYKTILETRPSSTLQVPKQVPTQWTHEEIKGDDLVGLSWILRMHSDKRITRRNTAAVPTAGEIAWAKSKFGTINKKGKCDLLRYLAIKTGSDFSTCRANGSAKVIIKGKND
jgi:hypothetical protein